MEPDNGPAPQAPEEPAQPPTKSKQEKRAETWAAYKSDFKWATPLLFALVLGGSVLFPVVLQGGIPLDVGHWTDAPKGEESMSDITNVTFATGPVASNTTSLATQSEAPATEAGLVVPFEILSVLLLAALIAGVVIALRDKEEI